MSQPLVSFLLVTYHQERFVREALEGAFAQTYRPLEIVVSDDCSRDRTFEIIKEEAANYSGPHKIVLNRNDCNLGIGGNINRAMELARGELIVAAAGDDVSEPQRVEELVRVWSGEGAFSVYSGMLVIDEEGREKGAFTSAKPKPLGSLEELVRHKSGVYGCTHAWDREVFDFFGPLMEGTVHEDLAIPFRSSLLGGVSYLNECLVKYRRHEANAWVDTETVSRMSLPQFAARQIERSRNDRLHYESWRRDLQLFSPHHPEREPELGRVQTAITARIELCELGQAMSRGPVKRLKDLLRNAGRAGSHDSKLVAKLCLLSVSPTLFYAMQWALLKARRSSKAAYST